MQLKTSTNREQQEARSESLEVTQITLELELEGRIS